MMTGMAVMVTGMVLAVVSARVLVTVMLEMW